MKVRPVLGLTVADIRCLIRTRIAQDFGKRIITSRDVMLFCPGRNTTLKTWMKLVKLKLTANTSFGHGVKLTAQGERKLKQVLSVLRSTTYRKT